MNALSQKWCDDPGHAYLQYAAAIEQRDVEGVLGKLSDGYGRHLKAAHQKGRFPALFELWCETFPRLVAIVAYFVDGDCATVELRLKCDGQFETGYAVLVQHGSKWCVDFECRANGRMRIPSARFQSENLRSVISPALVSSAWGLSAESRSPAFRRIA